MSTNWTTSNIPDLSGKTVIVTEGTNTIGFEALKVFSAKGANCILACKDIKLGERAKNEILAENPKAKVEVMALDLSELKSVNQFADAFKSKYEFLNVLYNSAADVTVSFTRARDGKNNSNVHHLAHFTLTGLLMDYLAKTPQSRVINLSGGAHKQPNMLFTYELQKHFDKEGIQCIAVAAHPGMSTKNTERRLNNGLSWKLFKAFYTMFGSGDTAKGALPSVRAAVARDVKGGEYYGIDGFVEVKGYPSYSVLHQIVA